MIDSYELGSARFCQAWTALQVVWEYLDQIAEGLELRSVSFSKYLAGC
jgi:hypothetical protein